MPALTWFCVIVSAFLKVVDLGLIETRLLIGGAQLEVVLGQRDLRRQACRGDVGRAGLRLGDVGFDQAPDAAPDIDCQLACAPAL